MYKVIWDKETNGVLLTDKNIVNEIIILPRPVFFEELNFLGFDKYWKYPKTKKPLLWASGRRYFYKGEVVAEAKGGNIYESPRIVLIENGNNLVLEPVDVNLMIQKNQEAICVLENEAMDFVEHTYKIYRKGKNKVDCFTVSFSGGKDSQVVLDIVSRIIPPDEYIVVFTDTDMELPSTYEIVETTKAYYQKLYPELKFEIARGNLPSIESWRQFGPPSMILRWCCTVHKTAPYINLINSRLNGKRRLKALTFDGVRGDESVRRERYKRLSERAKHTYQINVGVIRYWNVTEVFLYLFYRNLKMNKDYRYGLNRIGCSICPFTSDQSEYIISKKYPTLANKYIQIIKEHVSMLGIKEGEKAKEYISLGMWKGRGGGEGVNTNGTRIDFTFSKQHIKTIISNPRENFLEWIKTTGSLFYKELDKKIAGEVKVRNEIFNFELEKKEDNNRLIVEVKNIYRDVIFLSKLKKVLYKTAYCIHCGACEVECPTGALKVMPSVKVDTNLCSHCGNCLNFIDNGCLVAKSVAMPDGGMKKMNRKFDGFGRYLNFGIRREWMLSFLTNLDNWFANNSLGPKQVGSMEMWLKDAELLERKGKKPTKLSETLQLISLKNELLMWEIIWINLYYNSNLIKWYVSDINFGSVYSTKELIAIILNQGSSSSERTITIGIEALTNMFDTTPFGNELKTGIIEKRGNIRHIKKTGTDDIHHIAIAYSLYRYAQNKKKYAMTVSEFYSDEQKEGPYHLFGISRGKFENILRYLQENKNGIVRVDLTKGLDNVHLREDLNYIDVLELLIGEGTCK